MTTEYFKVRNGLSVGEDTFTVDATTGDVVVGGNLTVNGEATTLNTTELQIEDNKITLNKNVTGTPTLDAGIIIERGSSTDSAITWNESTDKWEQNRAGTSTVIPVSTTELTEGNNLYHTAERARSAVSGGFGISYSNTDGVVNVDTTTIATRTYVQDQALTSTDQLAEGSTNKYYTSTRANADFDTRLATKSTTNVAEGSNLYHTTARARGSLVGGTGISYTESTGSIAVDSTIATKTYADGAAASAVAGIVNSSPAALDTLNELAAALGNDANFATTVSTSLGNKLNTADFSSAFDGQLAGKSTSNVAEGTNKYYTDSRARAAISVSGSLSYNNSTGVVSYTTPTYATVASTGAYSDLTGKPSLFSGAYSDLTGKPTAVSSFTNDSNYITTAGARSAVSGGTGVTYSSSTGVISIGQAVGTGDSPTFAGLTNPGNYVRGAIRNSTTAAAGDIWALNSTGAVTPFRGISLDNSADTTRGPGTVLRSFSGGAVSGSATRGRILFEKARGTSASPTAVQSGDFLGSIDATGYTSTGWLNDNVAAVTPSFFGFQASENWVSNTNIGTTFALTLAPSATTVTSSANLIPVFGINPQGATMRSDTYTFSQGKTGTTTYFSMDSSKASFAIPAKFVSMSTAQRDALTPAGGWVIWNASTLKLQCYDGTTWNDLF